MLTNREKKLLYLLAVVIVVTAIGLFFFLRYGDLVRIEAEIKQTTLNIQRTMTATPDEELLLEAIRELNERIENEKNKFYTPGEIDLFTFSNNVLEVIEENNLHVVKLQNESNPNSKYVQLQLEGNAYNLARALRQISDSDKYWSVLELSIDNKRRNGIRDGKSMTVNMRIIYEIESNNSR